MIKVLFVCLGNLCRSPTAEGIIKKMIQERSLGDKIFIDSAATNSASKEGDPPEARTIACAAGHGIDLSEHRTRPLKVSDFAEFDLVLAMDEKSLRSLNQIRPPKDSKYKAKIQKVLEYAPELGNDVPDPYFECSFEDSFQILQTACKALLDSLFGDPTQ